jgi:hypothetical protein
VALLTSDELDRILKAQARLSHGVYVERTEVKNGEHRELVFQSKLEAKSSKIRV